MLRRPLLACVQTIRTTVKIRQLGEPCDVTLFAWSLNKVSSLNTEDGRGLIVNGQGLAVNGRGLAVNERGLAVNGRVVTV